VVKVTSPMSIGSWLLSGYVPAAGAAATAAAGLGLLGSALAGAPPGESTPARNLGVFGAGLELTAARRMTRRMGMVAEPYHSGRAGRYMKASETLTVLGVASRARLQPAQHDPLGT
jgi:hypothetical protein